MYQVLYVIISFDTSKVLQRGHHHPHFIVESTITFPGSHTEAAASDGTILTAAVFTWESQVLKPHLFDDLNPRFSQLLQVAFFMERRFIFLVYTVEIVVVVREKRTTCVYPCLFLQGSCLSFCQSAGDRRPRAVFPSPSLDTPKVASWKLSRLVDEKGDVDLL